MELNHSASIKRVIEENGFIATTTSGMSMYPMLRHNRDCVVIKKSESPLEKYDVALYISDGRYVLHRVISVRDDVYVIRGDNCTQKEYIQKHKVIGVLDNFTRNGKTYICKQSRKYRLYCVFWQVTSPFRIAFLRTKLFLYKKIKGR